MRNSALTILVRSGRLIHTAPSAVTLLPKNSFATRGFATSSTSWEAEAAESKCPNDPAVIFAPSQTEEQIRRRYFKTHYDEMRLWPIGKRNVKGTAGRNEEEDDDRVYFSVGRCTWLLKVQVRMHLLKYIEHTLDLEIPEDLQTLFEYYYKPKAAAAAKDNDENPLVLTWDGDVQIQKRGIQIKIPNGEDFYDGDENEKPSEYLYVAHKDFKKYIVPHKRTILDLIRYYQVVIRKDALERIISLTEESYAYEQNLMNLDEEWADMQRDWNEDDGPKAEARALQFRFRVSNRELREYIDSKQMA